MNHKFFTIVSVFIFIFTLSCTTFVSPTHAESDVCTARALTFHQAQYAITQGGSGTGIILGTRNSTTGQLEIGANGDAVVRNDTNCSLPISVVSYRVNNPSDPDARSQTFYSATPVKTYVAAHSTQTLHVDVPPCNFQTDFFYGDNYSQTNGDRYNKSPYFLDAGYALNLAHSGGTPCLAPTPTLVPTPPPVTPPPPSNPPPTYYPPSYPPYNPPPTYYPPPQNPPQIVYTSAMQMQPQIPPLQYIPLDEIPYTGLNDYPLIPLYSMIFAFWAAVIVVYLWYKRGSRLPNRRESIL